MVDGLNFRRGTAAQWAASSRILRAGEPGYETDTGKQKIGDGVTTFAALPSILDETGLSASIVGPGGAIRTSLDALYRAGNMRVIATVDTLPTSGLWSAHRAGGGGGWTTYIAPDGALSAARTAAAMGANIIDCDYQNTLDLVPVVMHDTTWDRTTDGTGTVASTPFALAPKIDMRFMVGDGHGIESVPTLEEWISEFGGRVVLTIETKGGATDVPFLAAIIKGKGLERSIFVNCPVGDTAAMDAIVGAGLLLHVYGCTTTTDVATAAAHNAWLVEVPYNASTAVVNAALAAPSIKRVLAAPIVKRVERDAMTAGLHGYVSEAVGYLDAPSRRTSIDREIAAQKVGPGWYDTDRNETFPILDTTGIILSKTATNRRRDLLLGSLCGAKPSSYRVRIVTHWGSWTGDTNRNTFRVCCPSDEGVGTDPTSRGYVVAMRRGGNLVMWAAPVGYGAGVSLADIPTVAVVGAADPVIEVDITPTTIAISRADIAAATLSGTVTAGTVTSLPVNALPNALASGAKLRLPNGQFVTLSAGAAASATSISVTSFTLTSTLAAAGLLHYSSGAIANTAWRGDYIWAGGTTSANVDSWLTALTIV